MTLTALLLIYDQGKYRYAEAPLALEQLADWPTDGAQVGVVFWDEEFQLGKPYRSIMMGNDSYFWVPSTGVIGHNDEPEESIRARYGEDTIVWRGKWTTPEDLRRAERVAMECDELSKLNASWLNAHLTGDES